MTPTEKLEAELEKRLAKEYRKARAELTKELNTTLKDFKEKDAWYKDQLGNGKIHQDTYKEWREEQLQKSQWIRDMRDKIAVDLYHVNRVATDMINGTSPYAFCESVNYETYKLEHDMKIDTSFTLYSKSTLGALLKEHPSIMPRHINKKKDTRWNRQNVTSALAQAVLQGDDTKQLAKRLMNVVDMNETSAMLASRTIMNSASNAGKQESINRAIEAGIPVEKGWLAVLDIRTRHSHRHMDMEFVKGNEKFSNGMMFPGDWSADIPNIGAEIYNCRCQMITRIAGIPFDMSGRNEKLGKMSYEEWKEGKVSKKNSNPIEDELNKKRDELLAMPPNRQALELYRRGYLSKEDALKYAKDGTISDFVNKYYDEAIGNIKMNAGRSVVEGKDLSGTWERRKEFDYDIEDAMNAQGFDGLPIIVDADEFEKYVKESNFIAQRCYKVDAEGLSEEEKGNILKGYRDQLYNGKWYVDCSGGGHMYGRGMYADGRFGTTVSEGMKDTMIGYGATSPHSYVETFTLRKDANIVDYGDIKKLKQKTMEARLDRLMKGQNYSKEEKEFIYLQNAVDASDTERLIRVSKWASDNLDKVKKINSEFMYPNIEKISKERDAVIRMDEGTVAVLHGYDAINCESVSKDGRDGYFVILNRTKVVFRRGR